MPFLDILAPEPLLDDPAPLAADLTAALAAAWAIPPAIITIYFQPIPLERYAHAGALPAAEADRRIFIKLHGFPRDAEAKRRAAAALSAVFAARDLPRENAITYFMDRRPDEAAHGDRLASDDEA